MSQNGEAESSGGERVGMRLIAGGGAALVAIAIWGALRAYTGVFEILNLRVFVGAFIVVIPLVAAGALQKSGTSLKFLQSLLGVIAISGGEALGAFLSDKPIVVDKFTAIYFGVAIVLPWVRLPK